MNWNSDKSISLSQICVVMFAMMLLSVDIGIWGFMKFYAQLGNISELQVSAVKITVYVGSAPAWMVLWELWKLLGNIKKNEVFTPENVSTLRTVSWCCVAEAVICCIGAFYNLAFLIVSIAAAFMALIVRIVKNAFQQALSMKNELDLTV